MQVRQHLENHILPYFGHRRLKDVVHTDAEGFLTLLSETLEDTTLVVVYRRTAAIFRAAALDKKIPVSPFAAIKPPRASKTKVRVLPAAFVDLLLESVPNKYLAMLMCGCGAGLRLGEVFGMEVDRLNFLKRNGPTLTVNQQIVHLPGEPLFLGPPKTESSVREVPMSDGLKWALSEHLRKYPAREVELEFRPRKKKEKVVTRTAMLVFTNGAGRPVWRSTFDRMWWQARDEACEKYIASFTDEGDIKEAKEFVAELGSVCTFHDLRHFFASLHIEKNTSIKKIQAWMGHKSAMLTLDTYGHLWKGDDETARNAVDDVLGGFRALGSG